MMMAGTLSDTGRAARRIPAARAATLRDTARQPIDIFIDDMSTVGIGMSTMADLTLGSTLSLQLGGVGRRDVRVVRRLGLSYGCEFLCPLDLRELSAAVGAGLVLRGSFSAEEDVQPREHRAMKLPPIGRAVVLVAVNLALWLTIFESARLVLV